jgi:hypothetical protein
MTSTPEAPALIQYACERCKTRFVLPPSSRGLSFAGKLRAFSMSVGRSVKLHEGLGAGYDTARRQLLAKMDDEAYQSFVQSFRFCHECRQFVCNECWSTSRRSCLTCVAKSMTGTARPRPPFAPTGPEIPRPIVAAVAPRKGRLRRDFALVAAAIAIVLVSIEGGVLLVGAASGNPSATPANNGIAAAGTPTASPSPSLSPTPTDSPTPLPAFSPSPSPSPSPGLCPTPDLAAGPSASLNPGQPGCILVTPVPVTPAPTPVPALYKPTFSCKVSGPTSQICTTTASYFTKDKAAWNVDSGPGMPGTRSKSGGHFVLSYNFGTAVEHFIQVTVSRTGTSSKSASGATAGW